jgi:hypothetical protein
MQFRPLSNGVECELAFGIPISALKITKNAQAKAGRVHVSVFALIHDSSGRIVDLVTRDLGREMKLSELPAVRNQWITYIQPVHLPAGHYTIDAAVVDEQGGQASAERLAAFVSGPGGISLSSIAVIQQVAPLPDAMEQETPFDIGQARILPAVNQLVPPTKPAGLYFVVYPSAGATRKPSVTVELFRDGMLVARNSPPIPKAEENGSLPFIIQLSLKPGDYEVRVTARQASSAAQTATALMG